MRAEKRVLKRKIEEDDKKQVLKDEFEEEDDKKYAIKGETDEEALEHQEEEPVPRGMSLSSVTSSRSTDPPEEQRVLPCEWCFRRMKNHPDHVCVVEPDASKCKTCVSARKTRLRLPSAVHADAIRALFMHTEKRKIALVRGIVRRIERYAIQPSKSKSKLTYGSSGEVDIPPCPPSYHTPITNALRNHDIQPIEAVRDEVQAVSDRTRWEVQRLTERLIEVETEMQGKTQDEPQDELQGEIE